MEKRELIPLGVEGLWLVPLTKGYFAVVEDADAPRVAEYNWRARECRRPDGSVRCVYAVCAVASLPLHRFLLGTEAAVDHVDGDGLNNTRMNLRPATAQQNSANAHKSADCSSSFKGVVWNKRFGRWRANGKFHGVKVHLGYFDDERDAARAYDRMALFCFGEYAKLNLPLEELFAPTRKHRNKAWAEHSGFAKCENGVSPLC